jgi:ribonuclease T1
VKLVAALVALLWWVNVAAGEIAWKELPPEARHTVALIKAGGPFPHAQDARPFGNRERLLPSRPRGYYLEYTVTTPGARDRGARRIVAGGGELFYTDDHYRSFRRIVK